MTPSEIEVAFDDFRAAHGRAPSTLYCSAAIRRALLESFDNRSPAIFETNKDGTFWYLGMMVHQKNINGIELHA